MISQVACPNERCQQIFEHDAIIRMAVSGTVNSPNLCTLSIKCSKCLQTSEISFSRDNYFKYAELAAVCTLFEMARKMLDYSGGRNGDIVAGQVTTSEDWEEGVWDDEMQAEYDWQRDGTEAVAPPPGHDYESDSIDDEPSVLDEELRSLVKNSGDEDEYDCQTVRSDAGVPPPDFDYEAVSIEEIMYEHGIKSPSSIQIPANQVVNNLGSPVDSKVVPCDNYANFLQALKKIDKNITKKSIFDEIKDALFILIDEPNTSITAGMGDIKLEFGFITSRDIEALKKDFNEKKKIHIQDKKEIANQQFIEQHTIKPKQLTEEEKGRAIDYLMKPDLVNAISYDINRIGGIVGEENNKIILYLASLSRKLSKPLSLVVFGQSSSGKSHLSNTIGKMVPPEDSLILSSASARSLEYSSEQLLKHKFILIQEWEGAEAVLATIRTLQSEGRLNRLVSVEDPESKNGRITTSMPIECPCSVVITTTQEKIHDENSTRVFELYADESVSQTENVVNQIIANADLSNVRNINKKERTRLIELHQDIQRCLENIGDITIPFADKITFPQNTTRHRRDVSRFLDLIKVVAFLHQKQRKFTVINGEKYLVAEAQDYEIAYNYGIKILGDTFNKIPPPAQKVITVCCALADEKGSMVPFSTEEIQKKATILGYDCNKKNGLYKQLNWLLENDYLNDRHSRSGNAKHYTVCFEYVRDQSGNIINIDSPDTKEITTPSQLLQKLSSN